MAEIDLNSEELSLVLDALATHRGYAERHGVFVEAARAEILTGRLRNGYKRKSAYNTRLLEQAQKMQDEWQRPIRQPKQPSLEWPQIQATIFKRMQESQAFADQHSINADIENDNWHTQENLKHVLRDLAEEITNDAMKADQLITETLFAKMRMD